MNPNEVIDAFVHDVMRKVPAKDRNDIGLELRGLLADMLEDRAQREGRAADDAMTLAMLRDFGTPAEVAARYRPQGVVIIPPEQSRSFALLSLAGIAMQWAMTLPRVFEGQPIADWWFGAGLGALWWPGFLAMMALLVAALRHFGLYTPKWTPRTVDPDRVHRGLGIAGLVGIAVGTLFMTGLPWLAAAMPGPFPRIFAFDADFLPMRAWPALLLWAGTFAVHLAAVRHGRWTRTTRRIDRGITIAFVVLMSWWIASGPIFVAPMTDQGAKAALALVILMSLGSLAVDLYRGQTRIRPMRTAR